MKTSIYFYNDRKASSVVSTSLVSARSITDDATVPEPVEGTEGIYKNKK